MRRFKIQDSWLKRMKSKILGFLYLSCLAFMGVFIPQGDAFAELTVDANHSHVKIDFFYHGSTMSVRGTSDPGSIS